MELSKLENLPAWFHTLLWCFFVIVGSIAMVLVTWALIFNVAPLVYGAESRIDNLDRQLSLDGVMSEDGDVLKEIDLSIRQIKADIAPAERFMSWVRRFVPATYWLPVVGTEVNTWPHHVTRVRRDIVVASTLVDAYVEVLDVFVMTQDSLFAPDARFDLPDLKERIPSLEPRFFRATQILNESNQLEDVFSVWNLFPGAKRTLRSLKLAEERMAVVSRIGIEVSDLLSEVLEIAYLYQPWVSETIREDSNAQPLTEAWLRKAIDDTGFYAATASERIDFISGLINSLGEGEEVLTRLRQVEQLLEVVLLANSASEKILYTFEPGFSGAENSAEGFFGRSGTLLYLFESLDTNTASLETALQNLADARTILHTLDHGPKPVDLSSLTEFIDRISGGLQLMKDLAPVGSEVMAVDAVKHYLVLGQSADELRATGGFVSGIWLITVDNGDLIDVRYEDAVRVDDWERLMLYPKAPDGIEEHMNAWVWFIRDVSWEPHFPETARTALNMYKVSRRKDVSGVIAINQWTLLYLVEALGIIPDPVDGTNITSRNLMSVLEQGTDIHGRAYMDVILKGVLDSLSEPMSLSKLLRLADRISSTLEERNTLLYMVDPQVQAVILENGWDGAVKTGDGDYLYVVDSNVGWSKVDRNIERLITYEVDLSKDTQPRATLTLQYNNHSRLGSPPCEPQWRYRGTDYGQQKNACYWNYLRVYVPQNSRMLSTPVLPLAERSVSVEIGRGMPGQNTFKIGSSYNKKMGSGLLVVGASERKEVKFVYDLPADTIRRQDGLLKYRLMIQKQPGILERKVKLVVRVPEDYRLVAHSLVATETIGSQYVFNIVLSEDLALDLQFAFVDGDEGE